MAAGSRVEVRGATLNGWIPVRCAGQDGWASASYLTAQSEPPPTGDTFGTVTNTGGSSLRCRSGPDTSNAIFASLPAGSRVEVTGAMSGGWVPVICAGQNGWISATYFTLD